jgi:hypothetical protein
MPARYVQKRKRSFELFTRDGPGFTTSNHNPKLTQAEIDAMQALSPVIFVNQPVTRKKKPYKKRNYESDLAKQRKQRKQSVPESGKLSAHFSKLSG